MQRTPESRFAVALACSDLHLTLKPPACREEEDWLKVQSRYLKQLEGLTWALQPKNHDNPLPVIYAGDIFDRWHAPNELVNWAIENLPPGFSISGQHEQPYHKLEDLKKSAYWTLVASGVVKDVQTPTSLLGAGFPLRLHGFPWGVRLSPNPDPNDLELEIAVVHDYVWMEGKGYPGAPQEHHFDNFLELALGYDVVVSGDNHKHFRYHDKEEGDEFVWFNCGTFMRRKSDETDYRPCVGIIYNDGSVGRHYLDTSKDKFLHRNAEGHTPEIDMGEFLEELANLGDQAINFVDAVHRVLGDHYDLRREVKEMVLKAMNEEKNGA